MTPDGRITDWNELPVVMHVEHVAALTGLAVGSIYKRCQRRERTAGGPVNFQQKPYEWSREKARQHYEGEDASKELPRTYRTRSVATVDFKLEKERLTRAAGV